MEEITTQLNMMIFPLKWMLIIHYQILNIIEIQIKAMKSKSNEPCLSRWCYFRSA